jgi:hypothetical protein
MSGGVIVLGGWERSHGLSHAAQCLLASAVPSCATEQMLHEQPVRVYGALDTSQRQPTLLRHAHPVLHRGCRMYVQRPGTWMGPPTQLTAACGALLHAATRSGVQCRSPTLRLAMSHAVAGRACKNTSQKVRKSHNGGRLADRCAATLPVRGCMGMEGRNRTGDLLAVDMKWWDMISLVNAQTLVECWSQRRRRPRVTTSSRSRTSPLTFRCHQRVPGSLPPLRGDSILLDTLQNMRFAVNVLQC